MKETTQSAVAAPTAGGAKDPVERQNFWWKFLAVAPCVVLGVSSSLRIFAYLPVLRPLEQVYVFAFSYIDQFFPLYRFYVLAVAVIFLRRKEAAWTAVAFLALGMSLPDTVAACMAWVQRILNSI